MRARSIASTAGALLLALFAVGTGPAAAEETTADRPPSLQAPAAPDGFIVTPPRPVPVPLMPGARAHQPQPNLPGMAPQDGCPYNGRKLDLIV